MITLTVVLGKVFGLCLCWLVGIRVKCMSHELGLAVECVQGWILVDDLGVSSSLLVIDHELFRVLLHPGVSGLPRYRILKALEQNRARHARTTLGLPLTLYRIRV